MIRILLADDHPLIRSGLHLTLEQEEDFIIVGEAITGSEAFQLCQKLSPDVLLLDLSMPGPSPSTTVHLILDNCPGVKVIMLTAYEDEVYVRNLVRLGVAGYILKDEAPETLIRAIRAVLDGDTWYSRRVIEVLTKPNMEPGSIDKNASLTEREVEVLHLLAKGNTNGQIADILGIAEGTVKNHIVNIYQKLDVHSRAEAVAWVWQQDKT
jgi:DNA-binding NarL/FixJ family response regulator